MKNLVLFFIFTFCFTMLYSGQITMGFKYDKNFFLPQSEAYRTTYENIMKEMKKEVGIDYANSAKRMVINISGNIQKKEVFFTAYAIGEFNSTQFEKYIESSEKFKVKTVSGKKGVRMLKGVYAFIPENGLFVMTNRKDFAVLKAPKNLLDEVKNNNFFVKIDNSDNSIPERVFKRTPYLKEISKVELYVNKDVTLKATLRNSQMVPMIAGMLNSVISQGEKIAKMALAKMESKASDPFTKKYGLNIVSSKSLVSMVSDLQKQIVFKQTKDTISLTVPKKVLMFMPKGGTSVAMVGVLAAIAIPNFQKARAQARIKACQANMRMYENALEMYDMDTVPPSGKKSAISGNGESVNQYPLIKNGYIQGTAKCPKGGHYNVYRDSKGMLHVKCSVHGGIK